MDACLRSREGAAGVTDAGGLLEKARADLHRVFGFETFRPGQEEVIASVLGGEDVIAVMPTGGGKSLLYQLPALVREGLTLVVSPLIALMRDQVAQLRELGIAAAALNSASDPSERRSVAAAMREGSLRLLYVAPERLMREDMISFLAGVKVDLFAIDEAHCVSQWGHDFRPEYMRLKEVAEALGGVQTIAVTATADAPTRGEIAAKLFFRRPRVFIRSFDRPNLFLAMRPKANATRQIIERLEAHQGESGIIYCASRRRTEELAEQLSDQGWRALPYHAGMESPARGKNQDAFLQEDGIVICATIAFGMGIDKPDVRFVFHADLPSSIEAYYQEIGRAGRDGLPADTFTLYGAGDIALRRRQIEESNAPDERKRVESKKLDDLVSLCETARCRRQVLLGFFGEETAECGHCDVCKGGVRLIDGTIDAQKAISAILRTSGRFFFGHLANILAGKKTDAMTLHGHDKLKTFGVGANHTPAEWRGIYRQLLSAKLLLFDPTDRDRLGVSDEGMRVLRGQATFSLREDIVGRKKRRDKTTPPPAEANAEILAALKALRRDIARRQAQPAYVIFPDRTLIEMAARRPKSLSELGAIHGVGAAKLKKYGETFLAAIQSGRDVAAEG
jgi:ATP-dependent DNA helicase RecQ